MASDVTGIDFGILDLLVHCGLDANCRIKFARHADPKRYDIADLMRSGWFEFYQATQGRPVFNNCEYLVSFIGAGGTTARFIGVFHVLKQYQGRRVRPPKGYPIELTHYNYYYDLEHESGFKELENRVIIEWGKGVKNFVHNGSNKKIIEILPNSQTLAPFSDYLDFTLSYAKLRELCRDPDSNREWRSRLSAVGGIYLILDTKTGAQYVGSAYGAEGIWGRWKTYANGGHGGNKKLKALVDAKSSVYPAAFSFSILQVLPKTFTKTDVIKYEHRYMIKLGSRAKGLNS